MIRPNQLSTILAFDRCVPKRCWIIADSKALLGMANVRPAELIIPTALVRSPKLPTIFGSSHAAVKYHAFQRRIGRMHHLSPSCFAPSRQMPEAKYLVCNEGYRRN